MPIITCSDCYNIELERKSQLEEEAKKQKRELRYEPQDIPTFKNWKDYAHHILEQHPSDEARYAWARCALDSDNEQVVEETKASSNPMKFKGKPIEQIPVARRDTVPKLIKAQLEAADKRYAPKAENNESEIETPKPTKSKKKVNN